MKSAIVYSLAVVAGVVMIWFATCVLPVWVSAKQYSTPEGMASYKEHLERLGTPLKPVQTQIPNPPPVYIPPVLPKIEPLRLRPLAEEGEKKVVEQRVEKTADELRTEEAIRGYHIKAAQMAKERAAEEEKARRDHDLEIRRLELETAKARAAEASTAQPVIVVAPEQSRPSSRASLREIEAMEQQNEELRLLRLQVALELARLRGENVTIVDYGLGAEQRRRAASIARAINDPDPLRREKALRMLGY